MSSYRKQNAMELSNGENVPKDAKSFSEILENTKQKIKGKIKELSPLDIMKLKEYIKRQKNDVKYYKGTSFFPKEFVESVERKLIEKIEKEYLVLEEKDDIDENTYDAYEYIDETFPDWYNDVLRTINNWQEDKNINQIWISKTKIDIFNTMIYWVLFVGNDRLLDFKDDYEIKFVITFKDEIKQFIRVDDLENEIGISVCSISFAMDYEEEYGTEAFNKIIVKESVPEKSVKDNGDGIELIEKQIKELTFAQI